MSNERLQELDLFDLQTIRAAMDSHLRTLQNDQDAYHATNNREGAENMRKEWHRVYAVRERVCAAIREKIANS